ncbi:MAG: prepilin-type N-terminal cleavage/methylation domain-containing protein, partial [Kiritimatiellae bacterium]|nr:prepilin-type N-terminal cleavage/methylation domain-containing protein [Kiritimatiellia bacterium]
MTRRSTRTSRRGRGAFTLVEVLVASAVAVAVAGAAAAVLWQGMRANAAVASNRAAEDGL